MQMSGTIPIIQGVFDKVPHYPSLPCNLIHIVSYIVVGA